MSAAALAMRGLSKSFGSLAVSRDITLDLPAGARYALIGPNGAGKTTLINLVTGMLAPDSGQIFLGGEDVTDLEPQARVKRGLARTFQINTLFAGLNPLEAVTLAVCEREGIARVGLLDYQDALMGPAAYDVASLLQDARIDVPEQLELALLTRYIKARRASDDTFDPAAFAEIYAIMSAQRNTKLLGIFARLNRRDGKPQYLRHLPRIWTYLTRSLAHPALSGIRAWYSANVPPPVA